MRREPARAARPSRVGLAYRPMREEIVAAVRRAVEPEAWALALWEGGSASFGRVDAWSDVDLGLAVEDGRVAEGFAAVERALAAVAGGIAARWEVSPVTDVKPQRYYRLRDADPWLLVDLGVFPRSTPPAARFLERRRHGRPLVAFDRASFTEDVPSDPAAWRERLRARLRELRARFEMLGPLAVKSARRGEIAEAVAFHQAFVLRPLVEVLRIRHDPWRHDFDVRYLRHDLPRDVAERVYALWLVRDAEDLVAKHAAASAWVRELLATTDADAAPL